MASSLIGNLAVSLNLETAAFQKNAAAAETRAQTLGTKMSGIGKSMVGLGAAFAGGALLAGISGAVSSAFDMASALSEASEKLGLTVEGLQRLRTAASQTGVSNDQLDTAIGRLNRSMGDLQLGKTAAVSAFAAIGVSADELKGKKPDEAMRIIADALNKIPDASTRAAAGAAIFGKGYAALIPLINGGSAALDKFAEQSKKNGEISTADAQKLDDLADTWDMLKTRVGVSTATIIARSADMYTKVNDGLKRIQDGANAFDAAVGAMARNAVTWVGNMVTGIGSVITGKLSAIWDGAAAKIHWIADKFKWLDDVVVRHSYMPDMVASIGDEFAKLGSLMVDPSLTATQKVAGAFQSLGNIVGGVIGGKTGGILGAIASFAGALAPLFGRGIAPVPQTTGAQTPGFASGGHGVFGGRGGTDRNLLSLNGSPIARVSKGEHFAVSPANNNSQRIQIVPSAYFDVVVDQRAAGVAVPLVGRGAVASAQGAQMAMARQSRRRLA